MKMAKTSVSAIGAVVAAAILVAALLLLGAQDSSLALESSATPRLPARAVRAEAEATEVVSSQPFTIAITSDQRYYSGPSYDSSSYFRGACEAIAAAGETALMVSPGDIDPVEDVHWTITQTLGVTYTWYPVVGNHELPGNGTEVYTGANMDYLRAYDYGMVNIGPSGCPTTTYSFDYENVHLVMLNEYCDSDGYTATVGDIPDHLYNWLATDLAATDREHILVFR
ncbi:MAG: hypothetical protein E3J64_00725, partial [Anaerolineales bacterium]